MNRNPVTAYEDHAWQFLRVRDKSWVGADIVEHWARSLPPGTDVLELACGGGLPVTQALMKSELKVWAIDSSQTLVAEFRARFPDTPVQCARVQDSDFFGRNFGAAVCIGLMFLLNEEEQIGLIRRVSELLVPGGRFLFTAPFEIGTWVDIATECECRSLGEERYEAALQKCGFQVLGRYEDEGKNNHYDAKRTAEPVSNGTT